MTYHGDLIREIRRLDNDELKRVLRLIIDYIDNEDMKTHSESVKKAREEIEELRERVYDLEERKGNGHDS